MIGKLRVVDQGTVVREAMAAWQAYYATMPEDKGPIGKYCLPLAAITVRTLARHGIRAQLNAGSAFWPIHADEQGILRFGYEFTWNRDAVQTLAQSALPEIHVWAVVLAQDSLRGVASIIDLSGCYLAENARSNGLTVSLDSPDYFWFDTDDGPPGVEYRADIQATEIAHALIRAEATKSAPAMRIHYPPA